MPGKDDEQKFGQEPQGDASTTVSGQQQGQSAVSTQVQKQQPVQQVQKDETVTSTDEAKPTSDITVGDKTYKTWSDVWEAMHPFKLKTPKEVAEDRKRQAREELFSAIGDGISAISNLYFTTKGAPNAYDPTKNMTDKTRARWEKINKEYEDNKREYLNGQMKALEMDQARDATQWQREHTLKREEIQDARNEATDRRAELKAELDAKLTELKAQLYAGKLQYQAYINESARINAEYAEKLKQADIYRKYHVGQGSDGGNMKTSDWGAVEILPDGTRVPHTIRATNAANAYSIVGQKMAESGNKWEITAPAEQKVSVERQEGVGLDARKVKETTTQKVMGDSGGSQSQTNSSKGAPPSRSTHDHAKIPPSKRK
jgi:hypothetical protein